MGRCDEAIEAYRQTLHADPSLFQAHVNLGQAYRDLAKVDEAEAHFSKAVAMRENFVPARHRRALLRHVVGAHVGAIEDLRVAVRLNRGFSEARALLAMSHAALGHFTHAAKQFAELMAHDPQHWGYHQWTVVVALRDHLDRPREAFPLDALVTADTKLGTCKQLPPPPDQKHPPAASADAAAADLGPAAEPCPAGDASTLLRAALPFGERMQVRHPGFVRNARLQRQAGLAVLDVAQRVRALLLASKGGRADTAGAALGWRAAYDVAVRWRQLGEPNDNVWWIDGLPRRDFLEGFGSHTPILKAQHETVRYYSQYGRVFDAMKRLAPEQWGLDDAQRRALEEAADCLALRELRGCDDFVVSPCHGVVGGVLEGTRMTVQARPPEGVEVSIRTPLTPDRWAAYDVEMTAAWADFCAVATPHAASGGGAGGGGTARAPSPDDALLDAALRLAFYWFNFMPLTRGSAAVGWSMVMALLLSCGYEVSAAPPPGVCPDWDAILTPSLGDFVAKARSWVKAACKPCEHAVEALPSVEATFGTYRAMLEVLNAAMPA